MAVDRGQGGWNNNGSSSKIGAVVATLMAGDCVKLLSLRSSG